MALLKVSLDQLWDWIPAASTLAVAILIIIALKAIYFKKYGASVARRTVSLQLSTISVAFLGLMIILALMPINDKQQLVTVVGIVITGVIGLSSATFVGNAMAGFMLRMVGSYKPGDFVKVGDQFGRVTIVGFLHTEIQTPERDLATLPNMYLVTNPVTVARSSGTIITCDVSLGYDVSHSKVEKALLAAAEEIGLGDPFMHVIDLGDFSVTYRINGLLQEVKVLLSVRSKLRMAVLDALHDAGIEIVSPNFMNQRVHPLHSRFVPVEHSDGSRRHKSKSTKLDAIDDLPDAKIFDKAEEAGGKVALLEALDRVEKKITEIKGAGDKQETDAHAERRLKRLEAFEAHRDKLREKIEEIDEQIKNAD